MERLQSFGYVRAHEEDSRRVTVVASTGDIARDGAIIEPDGWNLEPYARNPVVLWAHRDDELPIARTVESRIEKNALVQVHEFFDHPMADNVFRLVRAGGVNTTSVRWTPGETEQRTVGSGKDARSVLVFTRGHQLLETSYVPIPADPGAIVLRADGGPLDPSVFATPEPEPAAICVASDCTNEAEVLCADCTELLETARVARSADPRAIRLIATAERIRAITQEGAA